MVAYFLHLKHWRLSIEQFHWPLGHASSWNGFPISLNSSSSALTLKSAKQNCSSQHSIYYFFFFPEKMRLDISCESSARQMIHMKYQALFSKKKNNLSDPLPHSPPPKKIKMSSAAFVISTLRVIIFYT